MAKHFSAVASAFIACFLVGTPNYAEAQSYFPNKEWEKRLDADTRMRSYGPDLLGDQIDPHTGTLVFEHADIDLPGNFPLEVALRRKRTPGFVYKANHQAGSTVNGSVLRRLFFRAAIGFAVPLKR